MAVALLLPVVIIAGALLLVAFMDAQGRSEEEFEQIGHSRAVWLVAMVVLLVLGPILYLTLAKPKLTQLS